MRLFVTLFYLYTGPTFANLRFVFGWCEFSIHEWIDTIIRVIVDELEEYRAFPTHAQQRVMGVEHIADIAKNSIGKSNTLTMYQERVKMEFGEDCEPFLGAFGAGDGTYSVTPKWKMEYQRLMYTGYKKFHGYKLFIICSLFTKVALEIVVEPATVSDGLAYLCDGVAAKVNGSEYLLGDEALRGLKNFIAPFSSACLGVMASRNPAVGANARTFQMDHSSRRMSSEHVIGSLKRWAVIRGTSKYFMFKDTEKFKMAVKAIQSLHNSARTDFNPAVLFTNARGPMLL